MKNTVFGEVLAELLEERGFEATPARVGLMAERVGLDGWKVINRMASAEADPCGPLLALAESLELSEPEMMRLAMAYAFEWDDS